MKNLRNLAVLLVVATGCGTYKSTECEIAGDCTEGSSNESTGGSGDSSPSGEGGSPAGTAGMGGMPEQGGDGGSVSVGGSGGSRVALPVPQLNVQAWAWEGEGVEWSQDRYWNDKCDDTTTPFLEPAVDGRLTVVAPSKVYLTWTSRDGSVMFIDEQQKEHPLPDSGELNYNPIESGTLTLVASNDDHEVRQEFSVEVVQPDLPTNCNEITLSPAFLSGKNDISGNTSGGEWYDCTHLDPVTDSGVCDQCEWQNKLHHAGTQGWGSQNGILTYNSVSENTMSRSDLWEEIRVISSRKIVKVVAEVRVTQTSAFAKQAGRAGFVVDFRQMDVADEKNVPLDGARTTFIYPDGRWHPLEWLMGVAETSDPRFKPRHALDDTAKIILLATVDTYGEGEVTAEFRNVQLFACEP